MIDKPCLPVKSVISSAVSRVIRVTRGWAELPNSGKNRINTDPWHQKGFRILSLSGCEYICVSHIQCLIAETSDILTGVFGRVRRCRKGHGPLAHLPFRRLGRRQNHSALSSLISASKHWPFLSRSHCLPWDLPKPIRRSPIRRSTGKMPTNNERSYAQSRRPSLKVQIVMRKS